LKPYKVPVSTQLRFLGLSCGCDLLRYPYWSMLFKGGRSLVRGVLDMVTLFPLIFVIVANNLHHMIAKRWAKGLVKGLGCRDDTNVVINL